MVLGFTTALVAAVSVIGIGASPMPRAEEQPAVKAGTGTLIGFDKSLLTAFDEDAIKTEFIEVNEEYFGNSTNFRSVTSLPFFKPEKEPVPVDGDSDIEKRFIVPPQDDRFVNTDTSYPFALVGKIEWSSGVVCSGSLIGPRHVLTARHCLPNQGGISGRFSPGYDNGPRFGSGQIALALSIGTQPGACDTKADWAVLVIDQRLGDSMGYFGVKYPDAGKFDRDILAHQGYPGDRDNTNRPYAHFHTKAHSSFSLDCDSSGPFYTDTDTWGGQSGGPIWEQFGDGPYIWGTLSITVTSSEITFAGWASGNNMMDAIGQLRNDYP